MNAFEKRLKTAEELGDKLNIAKAVGNMGNVYYYSGDYAAAMDCYDRAIAIGRELGIKYCLCGYLIVKAQALYALQQFAGAPPLNSGGSS